MNTGDLKDTVVTTLTDIAPEIDPGDIDPTEDLREQLDIDSMDFLNFVIALHEKLGVDIPEADYPQLSTVDGAVAYLSKKTA